MTYRKIVEWPSSVLFKKTKPVKEISDAIKSLIQDMVDTCTVDRGVGLAANQIGRSKSIVVIKPSSFGVENSDPYGPNPDYMVLVNPILTTPDGGDTKTWNEACLSIPGVNGPVERKMETVLRYTAFDGTSKTVVAEWPFSAGLQHECDHLEGILYTSKINKFKRSRILKKVQKLQKKRLRRDKLIPHSY